MAGCLKEYVLHCTPVTLSPFPWHPQARETTLQHTRSRASVPRPPHPQCVLHPPSRHRLGGTDGTQLPDRIASYFFSPSHHQCLPIVEGVLQNRLQVQCEAMASHIKDVTRGQSVIARMELFFKIDCHNRCAALYCHLVQRMARRPFAAGL